MSYSLLLRLLDLLLKVRRDRRNRLLCNLRRASRRLSLLLNLIRAVRQNWRLLLLLHRHLCLDIDNISSPVGLSAFRLLIDALVDCHVSSVSNALREPNSFPVHLLVPQSRSVSNLSLGGPYDLISDCLLHQVDLRLPDELHQLSLQVDSQLLWPEGVLELL